MKIEIGGGETPRENTVNFDIRRVSGVHVVSDALWLPIANNVVDEIVSYHTIEHLPYSHSESFLRECFRILKDAGRLELRCPDLDRIIAEAVSVGINQGVLGNLYGSQTNEHQFHKACFNFKYLSEMLLRIGFAGIERLESNVYYGTDVWQARDIWLTCKKIG